VSIPISGKVELKLTQGTVIFTFLVIIAVNHRLNMGHYLLRVIHDLSLLSCQAFEKKIKSGILATCGWEKFPEDPDPHYSYWLFQSEQVVVFHY
jgi:hypothetical protein